MVKVLLQIYPVLPTVDEAERVALRPIGRHADRYPETIMGCDDLVRACDELGLWGVATIEHHFHSEGYEVGPNPGILTTHWAAITKNVRVGALGYVMSTQHPIRVAEETAIMDHLTEGRFFVGFARGYQDRWTNIIGQHLGSRATHSTGDADDVKNRDIFEEQVDMVVEAWTKESIEHNSKLWQIPYPYDEGVDWWMSEATARLGAPGEIGDDGRVHRISVVPAPYTQPHPTVFMASSGSPRTIEYCGSKGFIPTYFTNVEKGAEHGALYQEAAKRHGFDFQPGQNQNSVRWLQIGATHEEAVESAAKYDNEIQKNFYNQLALAARRDRESLPIGTGIHAFTDVLERSEQHAIGTVDEVRDQLVRQWKELPAEYLTIIMHYAQQPLESVVSTLETLMTEIKPALDELTTYERDPAPGSSR
jgi:alkanesulfonate monooxygenase SsuD/methylene tetrahydromethanopterin reductase-like flavin-dependent oxidoreductase (luciferase family)